MQVGILAPEAGHPQLKVCLVGAEGTGGVVHQNGRLAIVEVADPAALEQAYPELLVFGHDASTKKRHRRCRPRATAAVPNGGRGLFPPDIRTLYNLPPALTGKGQTIGIMEYSDGYSQDDLDAFWRTNGLPAPRVEFVGIDGATNDGGINSMDLEATLDVEWVGAVAPEATLVVYEADAGDTYQSFALSVARSLQYVLTDALHSPSVISISYGDAEATFGSKTVRAWESLIAEMDGRGITVCVASGDQGAYGMHDPAGSKTPHADAPASCPHAVAVGGTSLLSGNLSNPWCLAFRHLLRAGAVSIALGNAAESAWTYYSAQNGGATGGGDSEVFTGRQIPDLSLNADPATGYSVWFQGQPTVVGGTSVACPVFAATVALANEALANAGKPPLSRFAESLSALPSGVYQTVQGGNNSYNGVQGWSAGPRCTGRGSVNVTALVQAVGG